MKEKSNVIEGNSVGIEHFYFNSFSFIYFHPNLILISRGAVNVWPFNHKKLFKKLILISVKTMLESGWFYL